MHLHRDAAISQASAHRNLGHHRTTLRRSAEAVESPPPRFREIHSRFHRLSSALLASMEQEKTDQYRGGVPTWFGSSAKPSRSPYEQDCSILRCAAKQRRTKADSCV
ncbi:hypothetical protein NL676_034178 [Syzygium grande]|nr:hypothetical protein NL676_034178 [Syzygium grande]